MTGVLKRALVTGASGVVGHSLVQHLLRDGYRVRVLLRSTPQPHTLPSEVEIVQGDITDARAVESAVKGTDIVFHLAAKLHISDPGPELAAEYNRVNVDGTATLVRASTMLGVPRFVYFSTINVYGRGLPGSLYTETSPTNPDTIYSQTKREAETIVLTEHAGGTILRLAAVYGPRMKGNYRLLFTALRRGAAVMVGDGKNRRTLIYVDDASRAALEVAHRKEAIGQIYNVTDGEIHTIDAIVRAIQRAVGRSERRLYLPATPIRRGLSFLETMSGIVGVPSPLRASLVDKLTEDMAVDGSRIRTELGFEPHYCLQRGWEAIHRGADL